MFASLSFVHGRAALTGEIRAGEAAGSLANAQLPLATNPHFSQQM